MPMPRNCNDTNYTRWRTRFSKYNCTRKKPTVLKNIPTRKNVHGKNK